MQIDSILRCSDPPRSVRKVFYMVILKSMDQGFIMVVSLNTKKRLVETDKGLA
jgi:hypothetical protein